MAKHLAAAPKTSSQERAPWRATLRTLFAALIALASMWALIVEAAGLDQGIPWVAASLAATAAITRVMAIPAVNDWLRQYIPWLAPEAAQ